MCSFGCRFGSSVIPTTLGLSNGFQLVRTATCTTCSVVVGSCIFGWHLSWRAQMMERAHSRNRYANPKCGTIIFTLMGLPNMQSVQFEETSHSITDGQPYGGVFSLGTYLILFGCQGRPSWIRRSGKRFQCWCNFRQCQGFVSRRSPPPLPAELNFAVFGNLSVTIGNTTHACPEMRIAQGHYPGTNNWWIAGTQCYHTHDDLGGLTCPCGQDPIFTNVTFFYGGGCDVLAVQFEKWLSSILVKTNHFATHCAENAGHLYLSLLEGHLCPVEKPDGPLLKQLPYSYIWLIINPTQIVTLYLCRMFTVITKVPDETKPNEKDMVGFEVWPILKPSLKKCW